MAVKLNTADLQFVLRQIKISEEHAAGTALPDIWVDAAGNVVPVGTPDAIPAISDPLVPYGLRTVDGTYNNLIPGREIDLSHIDANGSGSGNGTFSLVSGALTGTGELLVTHETGADGDMTIIHGNTTDDGAADFSIAVRGRHNLTQDDFQF